MYLNFWPFHTYVKANVCCKFIFLEIKIDSRVARWYIFNPKIPIWVNLEDLAFEDIIILCGH
jgi:hypothetical protein